MRNTADYLFLFFYSINLHIRDNGRERQRAEEQEDGEIIISNKNKNRIVLAKKERTGRRKHAKEDKNPKVLKVREPTRAKGVNREGARESERGG